MLEDQISQCHIGNLSGPPPLLIETYLREADFWHVALVGRGCNLDPKLISALVERWRPETHTFHLLCDEYTIILKDVDLQLRLPVDELRYERTRLGVCRVGDIVPGDVSDDATSENQNWRLPFSAKIMGPIPISIFTSSSKLPVYTPTCNKSIPVAPQELDNLHHINLRRLDENWLIHGKPYLYEEEARHCYPHTSMLCPMLGWIVGHPFPMFYTLGPSHLLMMPMPTMTYRPSMHKAPTTGGCTMATMNVRIAIDRRQRRGVNKTTTPLNQEGIQSVTVDHLDLAQILTGISID
ncbi:hypothetical protein PVK06_035626 [Gossypium arboreum]|uniref:Aminotransferase-like plant mobile domain-containing protein n=1 Tax=Gossypium arboreum TaxID=29729 RepID=A0ABR0NI89_GOSAR|nr:hypothetical protein PVK06_035626 [Gossypium arboreum]